MELSLRLELQQVKPPAFYKVFKRKPGEWTFIHPSIEEKNGVILDVYKTKTAAQKAADAWKESPAEDLQ